MLLTPNSLIIISLIGSISLLYHAKTHHLPKTIKAILALIPSLLIATSMAYFISNSFTGNGIDESVLYQILAGTEGAGLSDYIDLIIAGLIATFISIAMIWISYRFLLNNVRARTYSLLLLLIPFILINPGIRDIGYLAHTVLQDESDQHQDSFDNFYKQPVKLDEKNKNETNNKETNNKEINKIYLESKRPKNLVFLYLESMERTYLNQKLFPDLMPHLRKIQAEHLSFTNITELSGTNWTIAGMVASQCGIPLTASSKGNAMNGTDEFLSNTQCIGDILKHNGYTMSYIGGEPKIFAGKGAFYHSHGFNQSKIHDDASLRKLSQKQLPKSQWGIYDNDLYPFIKTEYGNLSAQKQPFALYASTLDTHHPKGMLSAECAKNQYKDGKNNLLNAHFCADKMIKDFVDYIANSETAKDTILVLASDHLAMNNIVYGTLTQEKNRSNLLIIIDFEKKAQITKNVKGSKDSDTNTHKNSQENNKNQDQMIKTNRAGSTLDTAPTILDYLNIKDQYNTENNTQKITQLGLGRSLLSDAPTLMESQETRQMANEQLKNWRGMLLNLWRYPDLVKGFTLAQTGAHTAIITIGKRIFTAPILLYFNDNLSINDIQFMLGDSPDIKQKAGHADTKRKLLIKKDAHFIWIDYCKYMTTITNQQSPNGNFCMIIGMHNNEGIHIQALSLNDKKPIYFKNLQKDSIKNPYSNEYLSHDEFIKRADILEATKF